MRNQDSKTTRVFKLRPITNGLIIALVTLAIVSISLLWTGSDNDWQAGFHHPLMGWDHVLTMITVGIWAAQMRGHAVWILPMAFVGVMSLGGLAGATGLAVANVEGLILLSCVVFSILIIRRSRFSTQVNVAIVAFFAFFHGFAHGQEISASASLVSYTFGFVLATLILHGTGIIVAKLIVLSLTCMMTFFVSSLAHAHSTGVSSFSKNESIGHKHTGETPTPTWLDFSISPPEAAPPDFADSSNEFTRFSSDSHNQRYWITQCKNKAQGTSSSTSVSQSGYDYASGLNLSADSDHALLKSALIGAERLFAQLKPHLKFLRSLCASTLDFKDFFPEINYSPGKVLLSNGVGVTSPPLPVAKNKSSEYRPHYPTSPKFSFETFRPQIIRTDNAYRVISPFPNRIGNRHRPNFHVIAEKGASAIVFEPFKPQNTIVRVTTLVRFFEPSDANLRATWILVRPTPGKNRLAPPQPNHTFFFNNLT